MGFDASFVQFLLGARASGVSFEKCLTIGRQEFFPREKLLAKILPKFGIEAPALELIATCNGYAEPFLKLLGAKQLASLDASPYEGADIVWDMNNPIPDEQKNQFSVVIDGGSIEHIFHISVALKNMMELVAVGGHFIGLTCANNLSGHGFYQLSPEWAFRTFTPANGFQIKTVMIVEPNAPKLRFYSVDDPARLRRRTKLVNSEPALLMLLAKRLSIKPIFGTTPQQSDYVARWENQLDASAAARSKTDPASIPRTRRILLAATRPVPTPIKNAIRNYLKGRRRKRQVARDFKRDCYHEISLDQMARGVITHLDHAAAISANDKMQVEPRGPQDAPVTN